MYSILIHYTTYFLLFNPILRFLQMFHVKHFVNKNFLLFHVKQWGILDKSPALCYSHKKRKEVLL